MAFNQEEYRDIAEKLDREKDLHNGFDYRDFDMFVRKDTPKTVMKRLMGVGSTNTIYDWMRKREELLTKR